MWNILTQLYIIMIETIVETKTCKHCWISFTITNMDLEFYNKVSPVLWWKKFLIPTPTFCPDCRQQRRLSRRNERKLYKRNCDATGKQIISIHSPNKPYKVYDQNIWRSDSRDAMEYEQVFNFNRPFFEQFNELFNKTPKASLSNTGSENSEYVNYSRSLKNCYICFGLGLSENCCYIQTWRELKDCLDCSFVTWCQNCYQLLDSNWCFNAFYSQCCSKSNNVSYCYDIENCSFCTFCVWVVNKSYCILNQQYTKEEYFQKLKETHENKDKYNKLFRDIYLKIPRKFGQFIQSENCTWNVLLWSKNSKGCFDCINLEDCKYTSAGISKYTYDGTSINAWSELIYESQGAWWFKSIFISDSMDLTESIYCNQCFNSSNLFWCIWLRHKQYCILNKQYIKEEYEKLVPQIIEYIQKSWERWEFFPWSISPFWYNETISHEYFPYTKEQALSKWYKRMDKEFPVNIPENAQTINAQDLPDIKEIDANGMSPATGGNILNKVIICEETGKPFRIAKAELEFYRKHNLPLPHKHPDQRHLERMQLRNPRKLRNRECSKCGADIKTTYAPERPEIIYCEECYKHEIYG